MKRLLGLGLVAIACAGCSMVSGQRKTDGTLTVTSWRLLWKSEAIGFAVSDTNLNVSLTIGRSATDAESLKAVVDAAVTAAMKSVVPIP